MAEIRRELTATPPGERSAEHRMRLRDVSNYEQILRRGDWQSAADVIAMELTED